MRKRSDRPSTRVHGKFTNEHWYCDALLKNLLSVCSSRGNMCIYLCAKEQGGLHSPLVSAHFCAHGMCNVDAHYLSQLVPYPGSAGSCLDPCTQAPRLGGTPCSFCPPFFGDFIYYLWGSVLFGDSGFYFSAGFDRYSG